jgi:hypothetical protein
MRWTRQCARRACRCVRRSRVVLTPRRWRQVLEGLTLLGSDGDKKARSPGRARRKPLKPLRRECRTASAEPVCSCAFFDAHFAHETAGAACTRHSLRPLLLGRMIFRPRADRAARSRIHATSLRGAKRRSNPVLSCGLLDCFAALAMTVNSIFAHLTATGSMNRNDDTNE